jgi:hypothetical protein
MRNRARSGRGGLVHISLFRTDMTRAQRNIITALIVIPAGCASEPPTAAPSSAAADRAFVNLPPDLIGSFALKNPNDLETVNLPSKLTINQGSVDLTWVTDRDDKVREPHEHRPARLTPPGPVTVAGTKRPSESTVLDTFVVENRPEFGGYEFQIQLSKDGKLLKLRKVVPGAQNFGTVPMTEYKRVTVADPWTGAAAGEVCNPNEPEALGGKVHLPTCAEGLKCTGRPPALSTVASRKGYGIGEKEFTVLRLGDESHTDMSGARTCE